MAVLFLCDHNYGLAPLMLREEGFIMDVTEEKEVPNDAEEVIVVMGVESVGASFSL